MLLSDGWSDAPDVFCGLLERDVRREATDHIQVVVVEVEFAFGFVSTGKNSWARVRGNLGLDRRDDAPVPECGLGFHPPESGRFQHALQLLPGILPPPGVEE